jgi:hypothetical protein
VTEAISTICPKCGHMRNATEVAPTWQCPACGIAYQKYRGQLERARRVVMPPRRGDAAPVWAADGSIWSLAIANLFTLCVAIYQEWSLNSLMLLYWGQSVVIGVANVFRMLALDQFSTQNFTINNRPVEPTPATKRQVAGFFALHYGIFHAVYLLFLSSGTRGATMFAPWFWVCTAGFAANHYWSYRYNRDLDRQGTPNIGNLMFTPYIRIVPMHLTILAGGMLAHTGATAGLLIFGVLKTVADLAMHAVEHRQLARVRR